VETLRDVRRRVFDHDFLARAGLGRVRAILWLTRRRVICELVHLRQHSADKRRRLEQKVQEYLVVRDRLCQIVRLEYLIDDCLCKNVDFTWQTEAGKGDRKIDASLAIVDTLVDLLDSKGGKASATRFALNESNTAREVSVPGTPGNVGNLNGMDGPGDLCAEQTCNKSTESVLRWCEWYREDINVLQQMSHWQLCIP